MKKGDRVPIGFQAHYSGQEMKWTETYTGEIIIDAGDKLYHRSSGKIEVLLSESNLLFVYPGIHERVYILPHSPRGHKGLLL